MAIDAGLVITHARCMAQPVENLLSARSANELRPERIGRRLYLLRNALGLKSAEMADTLGIERTYWSRFENGRRPITPQFAALVTDRTGVPLDFIMLGEMKHVPFELATKMEALDRGEIEAVSEE